MSNAIEPAKSKKTKDGHITIVTDPTKLVQPYQYTSNADEAHSLASVQSQKLQRADAGHQANSSLQSSALHNPASLPALITVNKSLSAVISQQTSLLTNPGINIDMSLTQISGPNFRHIISQCVNLQVFRRCKFYNKERHGIYNEMPTSFCGIVLKYCNIVANKAWWYNTCRMIVITHTNHRNNCIKAMKIKIQR